MSDSAETRAARAVPEGSYRSGVAREIREAEAEATLLERERVLRTAREIVAEVEADARFHYKPALVQINAPLALIQVEMGACRSAALRVIAAAEAIASGRTTLEGE